MTPKVRVAVVRKGAKLPLVEFEFRLWDPRTASTIRRKMLEAGAWEAGVGLGPDGLSQLLDLPLGKWGTLTVDVPAADSATVVLGKPPKRKARA
jgi:hypothetical protein